MKSKLNYLFNHNSLNRKEAKELLIQMSKGNFNSSEMSSFLTIYNMRMCTIDELIGFSEALKELCVELNFEDFETVDLCGTGGDGKDTFNISTISSFVVAGSGYKVAKHGNYGVSSISGSSNMLEFFGYNFTNNQDKLKKQLDIANICFLHAPLFNPAMKNIAPIRRELGVKTFFNMLGPLVNPSKPNFQLIGVFDLELARIYNYIYQQLETKYTIVHSLDGYDEISLTSNAKLYTKNGEYLVKPTYFKSMKVSPSSLKGGKSIAESGKIFHSIIHGKGTREQNQIVIANSALAIKTITSKSIDDCIEEAKGSLFGNKAKRTMEKLIQCSL